MREKTEDLDPRLPRVRFSVDKKGLEITRKSSIRNAPVLIYRHHANGISLIKSVILPLDSKFCSISEDYENCLGIMENSEGIPLKGVYWKIAEQEGNRKAFFLSLSLTNQKARLLDSSICNDVIAGLFGDLKTPSELMLWDAKTGKELARLSAELGQRPYLMLRFTGITATLVHKDGAITKIRVVGRRSNTSESSGGCVIE